MGKRRKRCSTSTDVEVSDHKGTKPLEKETELHNLETDVNPKKRKKKYEIKEEEEAEAQEKTEGSARYECCFETEDSDGHNRAGMLVRGIDTCLARDDIKSALRKHFESGGCQVSRVFVPIECYTGVPLGFAFVDVDDNEKALYIGGGNMGESRFRVVMALDQRDTNFPDFVGCQYCGTFLLQRRLERWRRRNYY